MEEGSEEGQIDDRNLAGFGTSIRIFQFQEDFHLTGLV
jgi:hypothetical protein